MIFKHLFTPKWKHPKQQVRLNAIEKLDKNQDLSILNTLALEDSSVEIRRKALQKVNELPLWWQAFKQDNALKDIAEQHISQAVLNNASSLTREIKTEYVERFAPAKTLEKLAFVEKEQQTRVKLLKRLANPKLIEKAFKEANPELQQLLVDLVIHHQLVKSVLKHASENVKQTLEQHLENERLAIEMPLEVHNSTRVILAKLNALKDKNEYGLVKAQAEQLIGQWQALELNWLNSEQIATLDEKYQLITAKLDSHIAQLQQRHEQQQLQLQQEQKQALALANLKALSEEISNALQAGLAAPEQIQQDWLNAKVSEAQAALAHSEVIASQHSKAVISELEQLISQAIKLPEISEKISAFSQALQNLQAITPALQLSDYDEVMKQFNSEYKSVRAALNTIDKTLQSPYKDQLSQHKKQFLAAMDEFTQALNKRQAQAKRKARDVKRLIEEGRFNVAFGVFKGFEEVLNGLTAEYQQPLMNVKAELEAQLADAKDWQKYAAAPKREALLEEVSAMLGESCDDPKQRAEQVKTFRKRWTELGRLDTEQEKQQGEQFDKIIEQLFAPCRAYFAEQEQQREAAIAQRKAIITEVTALAEEDTQLEQDEQWKNYESSFNRLNKQWRTAAKIDPKTYRALNESFKQPAQKVTAKLNAYYKTNAEQKNALLEDALQASQNEDLAAACQQLKALQQQWQTIGFAGLKAEKALWQKFRQINDETFAQRSAQFEQQKQMKTAQNQQLINEFAELEAALDMVDQKAQLHDLQTKVQAYSHEKTLAARVESLLTAINDKLTVLTTQAEQASIASLFTALEQQQDIASEFKQPLTTQLTAAQLLARMEILANVASSNSALRMAEQVAMLDDKHRGEQADIYFYLKQYLALSKGSVSADNIAQLRTIFSV